MFSINGGVDALFGGERQVNKIPIAIIIISVLMLIANIYLLAQDIKQDDDSYTLYIRISMIILNCLVIALGFSHVFV